MIRKLQITSNSQSYGPRPNPEEEVEQHLTLLSNGRIWLSRYRYGSGYHGTLIGSLVGILGGPLGVLFGSSMGALVGSSVDADDAVQNASLIEQVCADIPDGGTALIALVQEDEDMRFERSFDSFKVEVIRHDAAEVAEEVEKAQALERKMAKEARAKLRAEKKAEWNARVENKRNEIRHFFEQLRQKK